MGKLSYTDFILEQLTRLPPALHTDLRGKFVMVVGANVGIGFEAAKHFASMQPKKLVLVCRDEKKGEEAIAAIEKDTGYRGIELGIVDLSSFSSVLEFANKFKEEPLDILVMNAGVVPEKYTITKDGWEITLQVNHLSTSLLSLLLVPTLVRTAQSHNSQTPTDWSFSRLVIVSSDVHFWTSFAGEEFKNADNRGIVETLNGKTEHSMLRRYCDSKLLNVLFTRALHTHLPPSSLSPNTPPKMPLIPTAVNPGYCVSLLRRSFPLSARINARVREILYGRTAEEGARQLIWGALGPDGKLEGRYTREWMSGVYVSTQQAREPSDFVIGKEGWVAMERAWDETIEILEKIAPEVRQIVNVYLSGY